MMKDFEVGINVPALHNEYGHDLGYNQFSGRQFWNESWHDYDFTKPDDNCTEFNPWTKWSKKNLDKSLKKYEDKVDLIRVWVFEQHEGLKFTHNDIDNSNTVTGIDEVQLLPNIKKVLDKAASLNMKVYLCLTDAWIVNNTYVPPGYEGEKLVKYRELQNARRSIMKNIVENPHNFIYNALVPLMLSIKDHPSLYAVDIMNEPEAMYDPSLYPVVSADIMKQFLIGCSSVMKDTLDNRVPVSTGFLEYDSIDEYHHSLPENTFDYYDFHLYSSDTKSIFKVLFGYSRSAHGNKKMILGEVGYKDISEPVRKNPLKEMELVKLIFDQARRNGISPCLLWDLDFYEPQNRTKLLDLLQNYRSEVDNILY
jgi:hypothetical protein